MGQPRHISTREMRKAKRADFSFDKGHMGSNGRRRLRRKHGRRAMKVYVGMAVTLVLRKGP